MHESYRQINDCFTKIHLLRRRALQQTLEEKRLHPSQLAILDYIYKHPGCTQVEISENMALTPAAITLATQRLQKENLIEKQADQNNLRRNMLNLTEEGRAYRKQSESAFRQVDTMMFQEFSKEDLTQLAAYLDRIAMNITGEDSNELSFQAIHALAEQICNP
ncbi:MAG: MarR family winged helix-turn-helix transcriptional regulator [Clostridia bacterium]|nr:MarR family winged helix-turn-helix transcriptional regulator [Clostridia bacterium]